MARSHAKQRKWRKISRLMKDAELEIDKQIVSADETLCISGLYGRRQHDPTARTAIKNVMHKAAE